MHYDLCFTYMLMLHRKLMYSLLNMLIKINLQCVDGYSLLPKVSHELYNHTAMIIKLYIYVYNK